jgi:peptidase S49-like protein
MSARVSSPLAGATRTPTPTPMPTPITKATIAWVVSLARAVRPYLSSRNPVQPDFRRNLNTKIRGRTPPGAQRSARGRDYFRHGLAGRDRGWRRGALGGDISRPRQKENGRGRQSASTAYWIATAADEVVVTPSGQVGSIGVFAAHEDISKALEKEGTNVSLILPASTRPKACRMSRCPPRRGPQCSRW